MIAKNLKLILLAGLLAGTLDISSAFVDYYIATGKNPVGILNYVASGLLGDAAFGEGTMFPLLGLLLHYIIAMSFTFFFFYIYSKLSLQKINWILTGILYGIFIWLVMNLVVVPLSNTTKYPFTSFRIIKSMLILIVMIALPLSFTAKKYFKN